MSLYHDAVTILSSSSQKGSLKSRIYNSNSNLKSKPAHIYALICETAKHDLLIKEIIENAGILALEPKLDPLLSLLLVHDHCFSKAGIAAPVNHPLRQAVERHKARLQAELTKTRIRRNCANLDDLKRKVQEQRPHGSLKPQPRWVRVNRIKSTVAKQLETTFVGYASVSSVNEISNFAASDKVLHIDKNIPDLIAFPAGTDLTKSAAYKAGEIILQDKASCIPAYLLLGSEEGSRHGIGDIIDSCAAPGNKTTHLASIMSTRKPPKRTTKSEIFACERDPSRSKILREMVKIAGAEHLVTVLPEQDFLTLDSSDERFNKVTHLLLDPSCSGSGIIGREDVPVLALPESKFGKGILPSGKCPRKRKRDAIATQSNTLHDVNSQNSTDNEEQPVQPTDVVRLEKLSNIQTRIVEHAFTFPAARYVTYSTCSIHTIENENVVARVLESPVAKDRGWRALRQDEQAGGLKAWQRRGLPEVHSSMGGNRGLTEIEQQACVRCLAGTEEGTMGFFVYAFFRDEQVAAERTHHGNTVHQQESDGLWEGFSETE